MNTATHPLADTVRDVLRPGTLHRLTGDTDTVSTVALDLACHVATGTPWHGQGVQQGRTLYVSDQGPKPPAPRIPDTGVAQRHAVGTSQKKAGPSVLSLKVRAWKSHHAVDVLPLEFSGVVLVKGELWNGLSQNMANRGYDLIVVDDPSWVGIASNVREQGVPADAALAEFQRIAETTGACVVLTQYPSVPATGGRVLSVVESGNAVSVRVADREGAAPFRFNLTAVPVDVDGDRYTPQVLTPGHGR